MSRVTSGSPVPRGILPLEPKDKDATYRSVLGRRTLAPILHNRANADLLKKLAQIPDAKWSPLSGPKDRGGHTDQEYAAMDGRLYVRQNAFGGIKTYWDGGSVPQT